MSGGTCGFLYSQVRCADSDCLLIDRAGVLMHRIVSSLFSCEQVFASVSGRTKEEGNRYDPRSSQ